jgi:hypothetical protein
MILVSGANKVVPDLRRAFLRVKEFAYPLEDARANRAYSGTGSIIGKCIVLFAERIKNRVMLMLVDYVLGY